MNGKTITCTQGGDAGMFAAQSKRNVDSNIIVKNGEFKITKHPVISYAIYGTDKGVKDFNFTFDNVKFGFNSGATQTSLVANYLGTSGTASYLAKFGGTLNFNNCTFDTKTNAPSGTIKLFSAGNADNYLVNDYVITGGSITASAGDKVSIFEVNNADSSVYFKKNSSGNYIKLTLPSGATAPSDKLIAATDDGESTFTPISSTVYTLVPSIDTVYGKLPARYEDVEKYPLAVFDKNKKFETATAVFAMDSDATSALTSAKGDGDVILLRRNYSYNPKEIYNNLSQIVGTATLDLNGFAIRCDSSSWPLFKAQSKTAYDSTLKIKNGTLLAGAKPLILFSSWSNSVYDGSSGKKFAFEFDNVNLGLISAAKTDSLIGLYNDIFNFATDFPVTFNNCTFDLRNATTKVKLFEAGVSSTTNCKSAFTVNGGKIIASDLNYVDFYNAANNVSSVKFGKGSNGAYTLLELPESVTTAPTKTFPTDEGNLTYSPTATAGLFMLRGANSSIWDIATPANITANGKATFRGMYYGTTPTKLCLIAAAYEGDKLTKVDYMEATSVVANTLVNLTATVSPTEDETVRYFLWEDFTSLKPYVFE